MVVDGVVVQEAQVFDGVLHADTRLWQFVRQILYQLAIALIIN